MRRVVSLSLISMIVLLIAMAGLLFYIAVHLPKGNAVSTDIGALATLPNPQPQQQTTPSEPVSTPIRLIFIVSVLIVFVSAALMLFRLISKHFFKEE